MSEEAIIFTKEVIAAAIELIDKKKYEYPTRRGHHDFNQALDEAIDTLKAVTESLERKEEATKLFN